MNALWVVVIILLVLAVLGAPPLGLWAHPYGYYPSGLLTVVLIILVVLLLTGKL